MKTVKHITAIIYVLAVFSFYTAAAQQQNYIYDPVETVITDLNNDKIQDTLILYQRPVDGDPGLFTKINISLGIYGRKTFQAKDAWSSTGIPFRKNENNTNSNNLFIYKNGYTSYIFLFGFLYGTGREEIAIIRVMNNKAELYFHNELAEPRELLDLDNDGTKELICRYTPEIYDYDENAKADIGAYSPFLVFKLDKEFLLDKKLTEKYNKEHYIWEGTKYNDDIKVVYPSNDAKPHRQ